MKTTKGPWETHKGYVFGADGYEVADISETSLSKKYLVEGKLKRGCQHWGNDETSHIERSEEECEANARLMAAAPALLKACQTASVQIGNRVGSIAWAQNLVNFLQTTIAEAIK